MPCGILSAIVLIALAPGAADGSSAASAEVDAKTRAAEDEHTEGPPKRLFTGQVVPLVDALKRRKISATEEELKGQVVLETADELIPIVPDWRGRAFFQDERLRNRKVELVGYRPPGTPYLKILMVFTFNDKGERQYTDYWCDICSIPMYEIQACECCQGPVRLRFERRELPEYLDPAAAADKESGTDGEPRGKVPEPRAAEREQHR